MNQASHQNSNYFKILGVKPGSSVEIIKRAYRAKLKEVHPDLNASKASLRVDQIIEAYKALMDPEIRAVHEKIFRSKDTEFDFREFLKEQEDQVSLMRLIVWDLFHGFESEAVELYIKSLGLDLDYKALLESKDYMDVSFVLAEELCFRKYFYQAYVLLVEIVEMELEKKYFKHFFPEVLELFRDCFDFCVSQNANFDSITEVERVLTFSLEGPELVLWLKRAIILYYERNQFERARFYYDECLRLTPNGSGLKEIQKLMLSKGKWRK